MLPGAGSHPATNLLRAKIAVPMKVKHQVPLATRPAPAAKDVQLLRHISHNSLVWSCRLSRIPTFCFSCQATSGRCLAQGTLYGRSHCHNVVSRARGLLGGGGGAMEGCRGLLLLSAVDACHRGAPIHEFLTIGSAHRCCNRLPLAASQPSHRSRPPALGVPASSGLLRWTVSPWQGLGVYTRPFQMLISMCRGKWGAGRCEHRVTAHDCAANVSCRAAHSSHCQTEGGVRVFSVHRSHTICDPPKGKRNVVRVQLLGHRCPLEGRFAGAA